VDEDIESKKEKFKDRLINELFVERHSTFKESVELINMALSEFKINYQYSYDDFCTDYLKECLNYMDVNPDVDMMNPNQLATHTLPIVLSIVDRIKNEYGIIND